MADGMESDQIRTEKGRCVKNKQTNNNSPTSQYLPLHILLYGHSEHFPVVIQRIPVTTAQKSMEQASMITHNHIFFLAIKSF